MKLIQSRNNARKKMAAYIKMARQRFHLYGTGLKEVAALYRRTNTVPARPTIKNLRAEASNIREQYGSPVKPISSCYYSYCGTEDARTEFRGAMLVEAERLDEAADFLLACQQIRRN